MIGCGTYIVNTARNLQRRSPNRCNWTSAERPQPGKVKDETDHHRSPQPVAFGRPRIARVVRRFVRRMRRLHSAAPGQEDEESHHRRKQPRWQAPRSRSEPVACLRACPHFVDGAGLAGSQINPRFRPWRGLVKSLAIRTMRRASAHCGRWAAHLHAHHRWYLRRCMMDNCILERRRLL